MTSADDFHLISWRNFFGLAAIVVGVMIPVGLRYWFHGAVEETSSKVEETVETDNDTDSDEDIVLEQGPGVEYLK